LGLRDLRDARECKEGEKHHYEKVGSEKSSGKGEGRLPKTSKQRTIKRRLGEKLRGGLSGSGKKDFQ